MRIKRHTLPPCGNPECGSSSNIAESPSFGRGTLDFNGFWEIPCGVCARAFEKAHPEHGPCWPYKGEDLKSMGLDEEEMVLEEYCPPYVSSAEIRRVAANNVHQLAADYFELRDHWRALKEELNGVTLERDELRKEITSGR